MRVGLQRLCEKNYNVNINSALDVQGWLRGEAALLEWNGLVMQPEASNISGDELSWGWGSGGGFCLETVPLLLQGPLVT